MRCRALASLPQRLLGVSPLFRTSSVHSAATMHVLIVDMRDRLDVGCVMIGQALDAHAHAHHIVAPYHTDPFSAGVSQMRPLRHVRGPGL